MAATNGEYASRLRRKYGVEDELNRYVSALYEMLAGAIGQDKLVLRAGKVSALKMMRSQHLPDRLCALARLVFEDPTIERTTTRAQQRKRLPGSVDQWPLKTVAMRKVCRVKCLDLRVIRTRVCGRLHHVTQHVAIALMVLAEFGNQDR